MRPDEVKAIEMACRREAVRLGFRVQKDRRRKVAVGHRLGYRITQGQKIVAGKYWDLTLREVEQFLAAEEEKLTAEGGDGKSA